MRIAFFNWRDIRNPLAGGAEAFTHQLLRRLAERGHTVTLFSSFYKGAPARESIDRVEHIRFGGRYSMYFRALGCYKKHVEGRYDVIVECINGVPFFMPMFAKEKVVSVIHQLTRENWYSGLPFPLAFLGYHGEDLMLGPYRDRLAIVPSESTLEDLEALGFGNVEIVHYAADVLPPTGLEKESAPTLIYLGRLTKSKRVDHALKAFKLVLDAASRRGGVPPFLWILGSGPEESRLRALSASLGMANSVVFFGKVDEGRKAELLAKAHLALFPAVREGWGLVVLEANACGTPVIGYDIPGLRDSIREGTNGYVVETGDSAAMGRKAIELLSDAKALAALSRSAKAYSETFSWDRCADEFLASLGRADEGKKGGPGTGMQMGNRSRKAQ